MKCVLSPPAFLHVCRVLAFGSRVDVLLQGHVSCMWPLLLQLVSSPLCALAQTPPRCLAAHSKEKNQEGFVEQITTLGISTFANQPCVYCLVHACAVVCCNSVRERAASYGTIPCPSLLSVIVHVALGCT